MTPQSNVLQTRSERLLDELVVIKRKRDELFADIETREDKNPTEYEAEMLNGWSEREAEIGRDLTGLSEAMERDEKAAEESAKIRRHLKGDIASELGDDKHYRTFAEYAIDELLVQFPKFISVDQKVIQNAKERLHARDIAHTLSSDLDGLMVPQHISQIMDIINPRRPVVESGTRVTLNKLKLTWPKINARPTVAVQGTEKTELSSQTVDISLEDDTADTYGGAANLSWQAVTFSDPSALELVFRLLAEQYAKKTEASACHVLAKAAATIQSGNLSGGGGDTFDDWLQAIVAGVQAVDDATEAMADTLWLSTDMFFAAAVLTSDSNAMLINQGSVNLSQRTGNVAGLRVVVSNQFNTGTAIVGDSSAFLVGENAGAPVQLRVTEPDIAGVQIGVVGAFKAISFDDGRFSDIGAAT